MLKTQHWVRMTPERVTLDGKRLPVEGTGMKLVTATYRKYVGDWPKYFKMDALARVGFVASELLLADMPGRFTPCEDTAVLLFNKSASLCCDRHYQQTISDDDNYFPSPAEFVYTLPNIVTGEICIRNKFEGESMFFVLDRFDFGTIGRSICQAFTDRATRKAVCGWVECDDDNSFDVLMALVTEE